MIIITFDNVIGMKDFVINVYSTLVVQVDMICKHNMNVFINRQLIYNYPEQVKQSFVKYFQTWKTMAKINPKNWYPFTY